MHPCAVAKMKDHRNDISPELSQNNHRPVLVTSSDDQRETQGLAVVAPFSMLTSRADLTICIENKRQSTCIKTKYILVSSTIFT